MKLKSLAGFKKPPFSLHIPRKPVFRIQHPASLSFRHSLSSTSRREFRLSNFITTLDPRQLKPSDHVDFSGKIGPVVRGSDRAIQLRYNLQGHSIDPFPPNTRGFLYFINDYNSPVTSEVRFRITPSNDPTTFHSGTDLRHPRLGHVWRIRPANSVRKRSLSALFRIAAKDGLITEEALKATDSSRVKPLSNLIVHPDDEFILRFHTLEVRFHIVQGTGSKMVSFISPCADRRIKSYPYTGSAKCVFERFRQDNEKYISIRVQKIMELVQLVDPEYAGLVPKPVEGELLEKRKGEIWKAKLSRKMLEPLCELIRDAEKINV